jgi:hypothetical protein
VQPALNGRKIFWQQHAFVGRSDLDDLAHLKSIVGSPCIEVALTKVVEGGVSGYYDAFRATISRILDADRGCDGWWISPLVENPQHQLLMINWKSVDVRHPFSLSLVLEAQSNLMLGLGSSRRVRETASFPAVY